MQKYQEWLKTLQNLLKNLGYNSWIYKEGKNRNLYVLETLCKELDFKFNPLSLKSEKGKSAYLRGFFDAEGGVPRKLGRFYIQLAQKDYGKIVIVKKLLNDLKIATGIIHNPSKKIDPNYWRVSVLTKDYRNFAKVVGSWHPIKAKILNKG